jgi:hypothetical protein
MADRWQRFKWWANRSDWFMPCVIIVSMLVLMFGSGAVLIALLPSTDEEVEACASIGNIPVLLGRGQVVCLTPESYRLLKP